MTIKTKIRWWGALAVVAAFALASNAEARRPGHGPRGGGGSGKDPACVQVCRSEARLCQADLRDELRACAQSQCSQEAEAACEACEADRASEACSSSRSGVRACRQDCRSQLADSFGACREETRGCIDACPAVDPNEARDRACLRECRAGLRSCRGPTRDALAQCRGGCSGLRDVAVQICEEDRCGDGCRAARAEARACDEGCRAEAVEIGEECRATARACAADCSPGD